MAVARRLDIGKAVGGKDENRLGVAGAEGTGLPEEVLDMASLRVAIPMKPPVESLNVAVAAALLVYEAAYQRE